VLLASCKPVGVAVTFNFLIRIFSAFHAINFPKPIVTSVSFDITIDFQETLVGLTVNVHAVTSTVLVLNVVVDINFLASAN
jgi:hypothetical protein